MRAIFVASATMLVSSFCCAVPVRAQCSIQSVVGKWSYNYSGWYIPAGGTAPVQVSTQGVFNIDGDGKVTGPGTWAMGAPLAGTPVPAGQMLEIDYVDGAIQVNSDCTGLLWTMLKFKTLPIPALGPYYGRIIVLPGRNEIEGMGLRAPGTDKPMWTYTLKRMSYSPGPVTWLSPPPQ